MQKIDFITVDEMMKRLGFSHFTNEDVLTVINAFNPLGEHGRYSTSIGFILLSRYGDTIVAEDNWPLTLNSVESIKAVPQDWFNQVKEAWNKGVRSTKVTYASRLMEIPVGLINNHIWQTTIASSMSGSGFRFVYAFDQFGKSVRR